MPILSPTEVCPPITIDETPYLPMILTFLILGCTWSEAAVRNGFPPNDKEIIRAAQAHWTKNKDLYAKYIEQQCRDALARTSLDYTYLADSIDVSLQQYATYLRRVRRFYGENGELIMDPGTVQTNLDLDLKIVDYITKAQVASSLLTGSSERTVTTTAQRLT